MLEDDVLALHGWYHRATHALEQAEFQTARADRAGFLYLRLFHTEKYLGWNSEDLPKELFAVAVLLLVLAGIGTTIIRHRTVPLRYIVTLLVAILSMVVLMFAAGKATVLPFASGVNPMNKYGCCSQGLVFPIDKARALVSWYTTSRIGFVDGLTEEYADKHDQWRWALTPSVLQHIGTKTSKTLGPDADAGTDQQGLSEAETLWNFAYELKRCGKNTILYNEKGRDIRHYMSAHDRATMLRS